MILSRVAIDSGNRKTMKALNDLSILHGALECAFEEPRKRRLWRIDRLKDQMYVLILSENKPDLTSFCEQFSNKAEWESKDYESLLENIHVGNRYRFRLRANPTKAMKAEMGERGKVVALATIEAQKQWLLEKGEKKGFRVNAESFEVVENKWYHFKKKNGGYVTLLSATYEGILEVVDDELFRETLTSGIGREKAYGMGLMTVMRV